MQYKVESVADKPITILKLIGELDASCYLEVIEKVQTLYNDGHHNIVLDLSEMPFMASSGLVSLHSIVLIMRGETPPNPEAGWQALRTMGDEVANADRKIQNCKIVAAQPRVAKTLKMTGFDNLFEQFDDQQAAIDSFNL